MSDQLKKYIATGFILLALAVLLGAFGAHALKEQLSPHYLDVYETANKYHFIHSLGMVLAVYLVDRIANRGQVRLIFLFFLAGIILFSGSLYILSIADLLGRPGLKMMGAITPIGGVFFVTAWAYAAFIFMRNLRS